MGSEGESSRIGHGYAKYCRALGAAVYHAEERKRDDQSERQRSGGDETLLAENADEKKITLFSSMIMKCCLLYAQIRLSVGYVLRL